jgi:DNA helicase II / ATP-dependent DNA helicase PcrA
VKYGGLKFMEAAHVKDTLACLRILENPFDEVSWFRVLQLLEGMGPASARHLMDDLEVRQRDDADAASPLARFLAEPLAVPKGAAQGIRDLRSILGDCLTAETLPPAAQIARLRTFLEPVIARKYDAAAARTRDLEQLELLATGSASRGQFLADLTLDPPSSTGDLAGPPHLDEDYLVLSTIHSAKGLEWDVVHVIHAADGMIPSDLSTGDDDEIEEERRLLYVALTRARDVLHVTYPQRYYRRPRGLEDPHSYAQRSRFLPDEVLLHFEVVGPQIAPVADLPEPVTAAADVDAFLAGLWTD